MTVRSQKQPQQLKQKPAQKSSKAVGMTTEVAHGEEVGIPLNLLVPCPDNVRQRKSDPQSIERLAKNIKAEGLLQNLVVIEGKKGTFEVVAGERRLAALRLLVEWKDKPADEQIRCSVSPRERALSASLAENHEREDMHPADQCEAVKKLVDAGKTEAQIAATFSVSKGVVRERLALANVAPEVMALFRADNLSMDQVEAFTVTADHDKQRKVLQKNGAPSAWEIKRRLTESAVAGTDRRAKFVGEKAYEAAGGSIRRDLFAGGRPDGTYYEDGGLLEQLAISKLEEHAAGLRDELAWVEVFAEFSYTERSRFGSIPTVRVEPTDEQAARIAALRAASEGASKALEAYEGCEDTDDERWTSLSNADDEAREALDAAESELVRPDPRAAELAGAVVSITYNGDLEVHSGLVRASDKAKLRSLQAADGESCAPELKGPSDPMSMRTQLSALRTVAVQDALAANTEVALRVLAYTLLARFQEEWDCGGAGVRANDVADAVIELATEVAPEAAVIESMARREQQLAATLPTDEGALWRWCLVDATQHEVADALAFIVARSVDGVQRFEGVRNFVCRAYHDRVKEHVCHARTKLPPPSRRSIFPKSCLND